MARHKKPPHPLLSVARNYLDTRIPELQQAPLRLRQLDGPPESPRFAVTAETCCAKNCPYGVPREVADRGDCPISDCELRCTVRVLFGRDGTVLATTRSGIHWRDDPARRVNEPG